MHTAVASPIRAGVLAFLGLFVAVGPTLAVSPANGPCVTDSGLAYFDGYAKAAAGAAGAEATIESINPLLCTGGDDDGHHGTYTWVAIGAPEDYLFSLYQIGTMKCVDPGDPSDCDGVFHTFFAWGRDGNDIFTGNHPAPGCGSATSRIPDPTKIGAVPGGSAKYTVVRTSSQIQFKIGGVVKDTIPSSSVCWTGSRAEYIGESSDRGNQVGGTVGDHLTFSSSLYETSVGGNWVSPAFPASCTYVDLTVFHCARVTGVKFDIWTDRS